MIASQQDFQTKLNLTKLIKRTRQQVIANDKKLFFINYALTGLQRQNQY